jgi:hypothetical protein
MDEKKANGLTEVTKELIGWEGNKIFRTLDHLTTRPGEIITEYCKGERSKYLSPVVYFFGVEALKSYLISISGLSGFLLTTKMEELKRALLSLSSERSTHNLTTNETTTSNLTGFFSFFISELGQKLIMLPILLLLTWLFYKKLNSSFKENSWFALYTAAHASLITLPLILYWYLTRDAVLFSRLGTAVSSIYLIWASMQFYRITIGKALVLRILLYLTVIVTLSLTSFLIVIFA